MSEFRNGKMTRLQVECGKIADRLREQALSSEELEKREAELAKQHRLSLKRDAIQYVREYGGDRIYEAIKEENFKETEIIKALRKLKPGGCAFIQGVVGCGKTVAAFHYLARRIFQGLDLSCVKYVAADDLTREHRDCAVLVIDDVGVEFVSTFWLAAFIQVLDFRYRQRLTTVLLTNLILKDWAKRYDNVEHGQELTGRIFSRIAQWAHEPGSVFLESDAKSLRTINSAKAQE